MVLNNLILAFAFVLPFIKLPDYKVPFDVNNPTIKMELSKELKEISALSWYDEDQLASVQDEAGILYLLDARTGVINEKIMFSLPGDFEGIEYVENKFYALISSGTLFSFQLDEPKLTRRIGTPLSWKNNTEGLTYDKKNNRLLIACKDQAGTLSNDISKGKAIYSFNLDDHKLSSEPIFVIKKHDLNNFAKIEKFKPSALAIDPLTNDLYVLASVGKLLVILTKTHKVKAVLKLKEKHYAQPEGICFSPAGDLYISNEGKDHKANIYHIHRIK